MKTKLFPIAVIVLFAFALIACDTSSGGSTDTPPSGGGSGTGGGNGGVQHPPITGPTSHIVSFETIDGTSIPNQSVAAGSTATRPVVDPTRTDFDFVDWYTSAFFTTLFDFGAAVTGPRTAYARWRPNPLPSASEDDGIFTFEWNIGLDGWAVTGFDGGVVDPAHIPAVFTDGVPVVAVGVAAFDGDGLTSVDIPASVRTIDSWAFRGNSLTSVSIPNSVTTINPEAFQNNPLTGITIPNSVTTISFGVFRDNSGPGLGDVVIPDTVTSIGTNAFNNSGLTSVNIGSDLSIIQVGAFRGNANLASVSFLGNVTQIQQDAFRDNPSLTSIVIPDGITSFGAEAFRDSGLETVTIGSTGASIGFGVFHNNPITTINIAGGVNILTGLPGDRWALFVPLYMGNSQLAGRYEWDTTIPNDWSGPY